MSTRSRSHWLELFVPGRICLFGEHSDWAGTYRRFNSSVVPGLALVSGTRQGIHARVRPHPAKLLLTSTLNDGTRTHFECPMNAESLLSAAGSGDFWSYACGVAYEILTNYHVRGLEVENFYTDLPIAKGLSSSAALCVLVARAFNRVYDLKLTTRGEMDVAYHGEIRTPSRCGRLDQCVAFGAAVVAMSFDGDMLDTATVSVACPLHFVLVDLGGHKDTTEILTGLNRAYPFPDSPVEHGVHKLLGELNRDVVQRAMAVLESPHAPEQVAEELGALMVEAQGYFDRYATPACPHELTAPLLHKLLALEPIQSLVTGGKGVGSQGDGTAQLLCRNEADQRAVIEIVERELGMKCMPLVLGSTRKSRVRKAVIAAAGYGRGLFPAVKTVSAPLFPVLDRDGMLKPVILIIVEEALAAGIEHIGIIVQPHDLPNMKALFHDKVPSENYNTLSRAHQDYEERVLEAGRHVQFIVQEEQEGFGHAVLCAEEFVGDDESFLLMLGDHLYKSTMLDVPPEQRRSCTQQVLAAHQEAMDGGFAPVNEAAVFLSVHKVDESSIGQVGVVAGSWAKDKQSRLLHVSSIVEKPTPEYARSELQVTGLDDGQYLGVFGTYVLGTKHVFAELRTVVESNQRHNGMFQLTPVLDSLRREHGAVALDVQGQRFDIGNPTHYMRTMAEFHRPIE